MAADLNRRAFLTTSAATLVLSGCRHSPHAGWSKSWSNPVLGGALGTCFDCCVLRVGPVYRMYFSWRPKKSIAIVESTDGIHWTAPRGGAANAPQQALEANPTSGWEDDVNRPVVVQREDGWHMWYTGQTETHSWLGYATSPDGLAWTRANPNGKPVLSPELPWEGVALMAPHVLWDAAVRQYRLWYSGGEQYEPNSIGYSTSPDGTTWTRHPANPILTADPHIPWERERVTAPCIVPHAGWFYCFYIGFRDLFHASIGVARSRDGITQWQRLPANPIIRSGFLTWDTSAVYKPSVLYENGTWRLWYNGRFKHTEQIGLATHEGEDLGFPA